MWDKTKVTFSEFGRNYESIIIALASERGNQRVSGTYITLNTHAGKILAYMVQETEHSQRRDNAKRVKVRS